MLLLAVSKSTERHFWKHEGGGCASKEGILWLHTEQRCDTLSFLPLESRLTDEPAEESADARGPTSTAIGDILDKRTDEKSTLLAMVQLPIT